MAPHSSTLAWKIPLTEEPGRLQSVGLLRVGHDFHNLYGNKKTLNSQSSLEKEEWSWRNQPS